MIEKAAILADDGEIFTGIRHHQIFQQKPMGYLRNCKQGFVTTEGTFVDRVLALQIAEECGQIIRCEGQSKLYSEDVWDIDGVKYNI